MPCEACGEPNPTRYVELHQNVGLLIMRFHKSVKGHLCKACIDRFFWRFTLTTMTVGWLGVISVFAAPIFVLMNVISYAGAIGLPRKDEFHQLRTYEPHMIRRLQKGHPTEEVVADVAGHARVSEELVRRFLLSLPPGPQT